MSDSLSSADRDARIAAIEGEVAFVTPGPWAVETTYTDDEYRTPSWWLVTTDANAGQLSRFLGGIDDPDDADFIAQAPARIAWLIAELRAALSREEATKKDAERYQRLRAAFIADDGNRHGGEMTEEDFDAEVDRNTARSVSLSENG